MFLSRRLKRHVLFIFSFYSKSNTWIYSEMLLRVLPKKDEDIVPDEYLDPPSPNPDLQQQATAVQPASGEHGGDRSCFCF
jgi:hypothetical protein